MPDGAFPFQDFPRSSTSSATAPDLCSSTSATTTSPQITRTNGINGISKLWLANGNGRKSCNNP